MKNQSSAIVFFWGLIVFFFSTNYIKITQFILEIIGLGLMISGICLLIYNFLYKIVKKG